MPLNVNLDTTTGLKFQQPNIPPGRTAMEGLAAGLGPMLQQVPSLMLQYQQLKQQRQLADTNHQVAVGELERRMQDDKYTQAANRVKSQLELLGLGRSQVSVSPTGEKTEFPGITGWEVTIDENGLPSLIKTGDAGGAVSPGVSRVIGSPGQAASNVPKSEFMKNPDLFKNTPGLKIIDDTENNPLELKKTLNVPGYSLSGDIVPTEMEARTAREAVSKMDSFKKGVVRLRSLVDKYGSTNLMGAGSAEAGTIASDLQLILKDLAKLGVLSTSDEKFLVQQISNPDSFKSLKISKEGALNQLDTTLSRAVEKFDSEMASKGYQRTNGSKESIKQSGPIQIKGDDDYNALPSGSEFIAPDGTKRRKP
jgi:hypothetical protein